MSFLLLCEFGGLELNGDWTRIIHSDVIYLCAINRSKRIFFFLIGKKNYIQENC